MSTSGTRLYTPTFADMMSEAFANSGIRAANVVQEHIDEAIRSANLMLTYFSSRGVHQYQLTEQEITLESGEPTYDLAAGTEDVWHAILRRDDSDTPVWPLSRSDYASIPNKDTEGRPFHYAVSNEAVGTTTRTITLWPVPDRADTLRLWLWSQPEAVRKMTETPSVGRLWYAAYADELSKRMAKKFAPDRVQALTADAELAFQFARMASRERRDLRLRARGYTRPGRMV